MSTENYYIKRFIIFSVFVFIAAWVWSNQNKLSVMDDETKPKVKTHVQKERDSLRL